MSREWRWFVAAGLALVAANFLRAWPFNLGLVHVLAIDPGWALGADALVAEGRVPARDFSYFYGLLTLAFDRVWFAAFGRTPQALGGLFALCNLAVFAGLVLFARGVGLTRWPRVLMLAALPVAVLPGVAISPAHSLEAACLALALGLQANGCLTAALPLAVTAVFVKPALGYVLAPILVGQILASPGPKWKRLAPATGVGLLWVALLAAWFGVGPLLATLFPLPAARTYAAENYGFFRGVGRQFWLPDDPSPGHYVFTPAGFWVCATVLLVAGAARGRNTAVVTCAVLHVAFVLFLFGNASSWVYYSFVLVMGACGAAAQRERGERTRTQRLTCHVLLPGLALSGMLPVTMAGVAAWDVPRPPVTAGLFAQPDDVRGWSKVRELGREKRVLVLSRNGAAAVLFPELTAPRAWYLLQAAALPSEVGAVREQIRAADRVVVPTLPPGEGLEHWPAFRDELAAFRLDAEFPSFKLFRRSGVP